MLKDIIFVTKNTFAEALDIKDNLHSVKNAYDIYICLQNVIRDVRLVANHYLVLDFTENYLQDSSYGEPIDKWRFVLNEDLEKLNKSIKEYLLKLLSLQKEDDMGSILLSSYRLKTFCSFVSAHYKIGFISPSSSSLNSTQLVIENTQDSIYLGKNLNIDLTTFENKKDLQIVLNDRNEELKVELKKLKEYLKSKYTLDGLL